MREQLYTLLIANACLVLLGCVRGYDQPSLSEPHALAKVRVSYHGGPSTGLRESFTINDFEIPFPERVGRRDVPAIVALRVRLEPTRWHFGSTFSHQVSRMVQEPVQISEQYACGTYNTGSGASSFSQTRYCTRYRTEYRWVTRWETVIDAQCAAELQQRPEDHFMYLIQYDVYDGHQCSARCYQQEPLLGGDFKLTPCSR